ncbi:hypothetical protein G6F56_005738 [Rhizopus delemar]|nr:hypothetical protein G6F56_005738 [Rhizopus delemar]
MTAYTLVEQPLSKRISRKQCQIASLLGAGLVLLSVIFLRALQEQGSPLLPYDKEATPNRNINFTIPDRPDLFYVDLDRYPIEDHIVQLFAGSKEAIQAFAAHKLSQTPPEIWSPTTHTFGCDQLPPYPILRRIVQDHLNLNDSTSYFENQAGIDFSRPFAFLPFQKQPRLKKGDRVCVRVLVPFKDIGQDDPYKLFYRPYDKNHQEISYPWWDTMMTTLRNTHTDEILSLEMKPWSGHRLLRQRARDINQVNSQMPEWARLRDELLSEREKMHMYEAELVLPADEGEYELVSLLEFVEARYNFDFGPVTTYDPIRLPVIPTDRLVVKRKTNQPDEAVALKLLKQHMQLPLCTGSDHPGRWLPLPRNSTEKVSAVSRNNKYWAPYSCRYRPISYEEFNRCVSNKYVHGLDVYGDSNMRRSLKKFISHGQWCKDWHHHLTGSVVPDERKPTIHKREGYNSPQEYTFLVPEQTRSCYCEDFWEPYWNLDWFSGGARRFYLELQNSPAQSSKVGKTEWDQNRVRKENPTDKFKISSYKWDGLTYFNQPGWETGVGESREVSDVAVFSLGNWDSAFSTLEPYLRDVDRLIQQIKDHYDLNATLIVYRTPQYYCCRLDYDDRQRQVSGPKLDVFDAQVRKKFQDELGAVVWDTKILGETRTWNEKLESIDCSSNHVAADLIEVENQIFMNGLCNK